MPRRLFINGNSLSPAAAGVNSATGLIPQAFPDVVAGDKVQFRFFLVDGKGNYDPISGDVTNYTLKLALGQITTQQILTSTTTFTSAAEVIEGVSTAAWQCTLDCGAAAVLTAVGSLPAIDAFIELEVKETAGAQTLVTYCQMKVQVRNRILT